MSYDQLKPWFLYGGPVLAAVLLLLGLILEGLFGDWFVLADAEPFAGGWLSAGNFAAGIFAAGTFSCGVFSVGIFSFGLFSLGIFSIGLVSCGPFAIGLLALGVHVIGKYRMSEVDAQVRAHEEARHARRQGTDPQHRAGNGAERTDDATKQPQHEPSHSQ